MILVILVPLFDLKFLSELAAGGVGTSNRRHQLNKQWLLKGFQRAIDGAARSECGHTRDQGDHDDHGGVAEVTDRKAAEQGPKLLAGGAAQELAACQLDQAKQRQGTATPDDAPLQAKAEKPALKMLGNEGVLGADQVQHLDHGAVGCNRPA